MSEEEGDDVLTPEAEDILDAVWAKIAAEDAAIADNARRKAAYELKKKQKEKKKPG
jgi:hypothetical protein